MRIVALAAALMLAGCSADEVSAPTPLAADPSPSAVEVNNDPILKVPALPEIGSGLLPLYRYLHANPELSNGEVETAKIMADRLRAFGFEVTEGVGGLGVVGVLENGSGKTVMLRADMDGLPVKENTGLNYASAVMREGADGKLLPAMHACGHDVHMTGTLGAAQDLADAQDEWSGTLVVIFQPAEEIVEGALQMLDDGLFTRFPRPDYNLAYHVNAGMAAGTIGMVPGFALANVDSVDISVKGVGGHGAYPHTTVDPVVLSAAIIMNLQTLVSRNVDPREAAVVTVGTIAGGTKRNIISEEVLLQLTVRSYTDDVRAQTLAGIERIAEHTARAFGMDDDALPVVTRLPESAPATFNDPDMTRALTQTFLTEFGPEAISQVAPVMAAEDFAHYGRTDHPSIGKTAIPSHIFWLGAASPGIVASGNPLPSLHSPEFAPDAERAVPMGARALTVGAISLFSTQD